MALKIFKVKNNLAPEIIKNISSFKTLLIVLETAEHSNVEALKQFSMDQGLYPA